MGVRPVGTVFVVVMVSTVMVAEGSLPVTISTWAYPDATQKGKTIMRLLILAGSTNLQINISLFSMASSYVRQSCMTFSIHCTARSLKLHS